MAYTKLFSSIVTSTIWSEDDKTRIVWITMLAIADKNGEVQASIPGLARVAGVSIEDCEKAVERFLSPDPYSRTPDDEGRRIEAIPGGWHLLNYAKYRLMASRDESRDANAERQKRWRDRQKRNGKSVTRNASVTDTLHIAEAEAEAEIKSENENQKSESLASISSETYDVPKALPDPEESEQASPSNFERISEKAFLTLARRLEIPEDFALVQFIDLQAAGWNDASGKRIAHLGQFLKAAWKREQEKGEDPRGTRQAWKIEADIARIKGEIRRIEDDKSNRHPAGPSFEDHKMKFEGEWLKLVGSLYAEAKTALPDEVAEFHRKHDQKKAEMIRDKVPAAMVEDRDFMLVEFQAFMPEDDVPSFERWDREWNKANAWIKPDSLKPEAREAVKVLRENLRRLEREKSVVLQGKAA